MTIQRSFNSATTAADAMDTLNTLLPDGKFTSTPAALRTPSNMATQMGSMSASPFAFMTSMPGTAIYVDPTETYQQMAGAGASLTDSACYVLANYCTPAQRRQILQTVFSDDGFSTTRFSMGSCDFTWRGIGNHYTYADNDDGSDLTLPNFTIQKDLEYMVPMIREALAVNPALKLIGSPWSPPAFMKTFPTLNGRGPDGTTVNKFVATAANMQMYALYFVKFLQAYKALGINLWAISIQNEPHYGTPDYPGCVWSGVDMTSFIKILGPALGDAGFGSVKIFTGEMNWKQTSGYSGGSGDLLLNVWADPIAAGYCSGSAWHGYVNGSNKHDFEDQRAKNFLGKELHLTEFCLGPVSAGSYNTNFQQHLGNCIIGSIRAGANSVTFWNLFLDSTNRPSATPNPTVSPCATISIDGNATLFKNPSYMALAHLLKAMKPNARRCRSTTFGVGEADRDVQSVAFHNTDGSVGVLLWNNATVAKNISLVDAPTKLVSFLTLAAGDVVTVNYTVSKGVTAAATLAAPSPVTSVSAASANGANTISWVAPTAPDASGYTGFVIRRGTTAGGAKQPVGAALPGDRSFVDIDVVAGARWYYEVYPITGGGLATSSPEATVLAVANKPSAPVIALATQTGKVTVSLTKVAAANGSAITGYNIYRGTTSGGQSATPIASNVAMPYDDTTISNGTQYFYTAAAVNGLGEGTKSAEASGTPGTLTKPGPGNLLSDDVGGANATASGTKSTVGWSNTAWTFAPNTSATTNHNAIAGPNGSTLDASTITFTNAGASGGYSSVECATTAAIGAVPVEYSVWLKGKAGGEAIQIVLSDGDHNTSQIVKPITLTNTWARYSIQGTISTQPTKVQVVQIGTYGALNGTIAFDAAWANHKNI
jgi:O-glycosyl hydrolase